MNNLIEYMTVRALSTILLSSDPRTAGVNLILLCVAMTLFSVWLLKQGSKAERFGMILFSVIVLLSR